MKITINCIVYDIKAERANSHELALPKEIKKRISIKFYCCILYKYKLERCIISINDFFAF